MSSEPSPTQPPPLSQLRFQYQAVAPLQAGSSGWHEALVRWHQPDGTIRGPRDVLPYWLGDQRQPVFTQFTVTQAALILQADPVGRLSINLSPGQVTHPTVLGTLEDLLPVVRRRLIIELTEQHYGDVARLWTSLAALSERCELVLLDDVTVDDLKRRSRANAPVDGIKLDRSVLRHLVDPRWSEAKAIRELVREAACRYSIVVAEGIENARDVAALEGLGITHAQGFGIGRPTERPNVDAIAILPIGSGTWSLPQEPAADVRVDAAHRPPPD